MAFGFLQQISNPGQVNPCNHKQNLKNMYLHWYLVKKGWELTNSTICYNVFNSVNISMMAPKKGFRGVLCNAGGWYCIGFKQTQRDPPHNILFVTMNQYQVGMAEGVSGSTMIFLCALQ